MSIIEDLQSLLDEKRNQVEEVKKVLDRFTMFGTYTIRDYENAMGDLRRL